jgi:chemotaxis protein methyltransferase CheR
MTEEKIDIADIRRLTKTIHSVYGFDFSEYAKASFKRRISRVLIVFKLNDTVELIKLIETDGVFRKKFLFEITVNTTEMFRDPSLWRFFINSVLPEYADYKNIRIWHAGCSSGEEVYTMNIVLLESGLFEKTKITATDISKEVIESAKNGVHTLRNTELNSKNYLRVTDNDDLKKYYTIQGTNCQMNKSLISNVDFQVHNLASKKGAFMKFNIIFCRNVLIYFNSILQKEVFSLFHESLSVGGVLVIGSQESMIANSLRDKYELLDKSEQVYKKIKD